MKIREGNKMKAAQYYAVNLCLKSVHVIKRVHWGEREHISPDGREE